jgi:AcrR family transcriptional regulator
MGLRAGCFTDYETERRMLDAARDAVVRAGLTVSLEHISLEELIREAGVSHSAVFRRWPYRDLFLRDLIKELARDAVPSIDDQEIEAIERVIAERVDRLETPEDRDGLVAELIREIALMHFEMLHQSAKWSTYLALNAACLSITDDETRDEVRSALAESEQAHIRAVAKVLEVLAGLVGYRLRPETAASFDTLATLNTAALHGLITMAISDPALATQRLQAAPFWPNDGAEWSLPAMALASNVAALLEPDPDTDWRAERAAALREVVGGDQDPSKID